MTAHIAIVHAVPVDQIEVASFVRTSNGYDRDSLRELAESIKEHGLIQPIVIRPNGEGEGVSREKYAIVAGRRRLAACKLAGLTEAPCIITDTDESKAYELEIAENIQREQMTLHDTARAVRTLFMIHGNAKTVQRIVNKSAAWVSKHLAVTADSFPTPLAELLASGLVSDLEALTMTAQIAKMTPGPEQLRAYTNLLNLGAAGQLTRAEAKRQLDKLRQTVAKGQPSDSGTNDDAGEGQGEQKDEGGTDGDEEGRRTAKGGGFAKAVPAARALNAMSNISDGLDKVAKFLAKGMPAAAADQLAELQATVVEYRRRIANSDL